MKVPRCCSGLGLGLGLGSRVSGLGSRVSGLGSRVSGLGSRVSGLSLLADRGQGGGRAVSPTASVPLRQLERGIISPPSQRCCRDSNHPMDVRKGVKQNQFLTEDVPLARAGRRRTSPRTGRPASPPLSFRFHLTRFRFRWFVLGVGSAVSRIAVAPGRACRRLRPSRNTKWNKGMV